MPRVCGRKISAPLLLLIGDQRQILRDILEVRRHGILNQIFRQDADRIRHIEQFLRAQGPERVRGLDPVVVGLLDSHHGHVRQLAAPDRRRRIGCGILGAGGLGEGNRRESKQYCKANRLGH